MRGIVINYFWSTVIIICEVLKWVAAREILKYWGK